MTQERYPSNSVSQRVMVRMKSWMQPPMRKKIESKTMILKKNNKKNPKGNKLLPPLTPLSMMRLRADKSQPGRRKTPKRKRLLTLLSMMSLKLRVDRSQLSQKKEKLKSLERSRMRLLSPLSTMSLKPRGDKSQPDRRNQRKIPRKRRFLTHLLMMLRSQKADKSQLSKRKKRLLTPLSIMLLSP